MLAVNLEPGVSRTRNLLVTSPILYQLDHCNCTANLFEEIVNMFEKLTICLYIIIDIFACPLLDLDSGIIVVVVIVSYTGTKLYHGNGEDVHYGCSD